MLGLIFHSFITILKSVMSGALSIKSSVTEGTMHEEYRGAYFST